MKTNEKYFLFNLNSAHANILLIFFKVILRKLAFAFLLS